MTVSARPLLCAATCLVALASARALSHSPEPQDRAAAAASRPRVLVTNDDGIESAGLRALVKELATMAEVVVSAPSGNRSGSSQSITLMNTPLLVKDVEMEGAAVARAVDGTPADAANFGLLHLAGDRPFDVLVSGMNHGLNVGEMSRYSGTVGAAMEGASRGVPSIAVSLDAQTKLEDAARFARGFVERRLEHDTDPAVVHSINFPAGGRERWKGVVVTPMGGAYLQVKGYRETRSTDEGTIYRSRMQTVREGPEGSDTEVCFSGSISITPLRYDWTHREALEELQTWDFDLGG